MPVSRECFYCKKKLLTSTYGLVFHMENECLPYQDFLKKQKAKHINNIKNINEKTSETDLKKSSFKSLAKI